MSSEGCQKAYTCKICSNWKSSIAFMFVWSWWTLPVLLTTKVSLENRKQRFVYLLHRVRFNACYYALLHEELWGYFLTKLSNNKWNDFVKYIQNAFKSNRPRFIVKLYILHSWNEFVISIRWCLSEILTSQILP